MPPAFLRRSLPLALMAVLAIAPSACRDKNAGAVKVIVIGGAPKIRDPALGPLSSPDAVLLANVGQGLVRFDATGNIVGGLAERWNVSDDGLSYIFRLAAADWQDGRKVSAQQVARQLKRSIGGASANPFKDTLGAVDDIVAMTDRVIEIRLTAPRPNLLALLAQPELAITRTGAGTGPFRVAADPTTPGRLRLARTISSPDEEASRSEEILFAGAAALEAIRAFTDGNADIVLGGSGADLPYVFGAKLPRGSLRFDPASGLFGLLPVRKGSVLDNVEVRHLLNQAIDRDALTNALRVPGLAARTTVLEPALEGVPDPVQPSWLATPVAERRVGLSAEATRLFGNEKPAVRLFLPEGPGSDIVFNRLAADWGALGLTVERSNSVSTADFKLIDSVAPSTSPAWFLRQFRCQVVPVCDPQADELLDGARDTLVAAQRGALLAQAAARIDDAQLFLPLAAPIRWSLVSGRVPGFVGNRYARHTLTDLEQKPSSGAP
jgi:peptide/nickel transport system substrate-binding protein